MTTNDFVIELINDAKRASLVLAFVWSAVIVAMIIDLVAGVRKAKRAGISRTSYGYRRSVSKFCRYGTALLFTLLGDAIMIVGTLYDIPFASVVCALGLCLIEAKSWFEKLEEKERARLLDSLEDAAKVAATRDPRTILDELREAHDNATRENQTDV